MLGVCGAVAASENDCVSSQDFSVVQNALTNLPGDSAGIIVWIGIGNVQHSVVFLNRTGPIWLGNFTLPSGIENKNGSIGWAPSLPLGWGKQDDPNGWVPPIDMFGWGKQDDPN